MRCFVALVPPAPCLVELRPYIEECAEKYREWRWVRPEGVHLTLAFLGDIGAKAVEAASGAVLAMDGLPIAPRIGFGAPEGFPPRASARVWCLPVVSGREAVRTLWRAFNVELESRAAMANLAPLNPDSRRGKPFLPHLTLARPRRSGAPKPAGAGAPALKALEFECRRVALFESLTGSGAARYRVVMEAELSSIC